MLYNGYFFKFKVMNLQILWHLFDVDSV